MRKFHKYSSIFLLALFLSNTLSALEVYKAKATASFYGADFHGKPTSNGEVFNMYDYTCANKELPFDTILKVTNLANGKSVQVRVNDRGPFVAGRDLDLSTQAAIDLGMTKAGLAQVKLEIVKMGPNTKLSRDTAASAEKIMAKITGNAASAKTSTSASVSVPKEENSKKSETAKPVPEGTLWDIQVASFSSRDNATAFAKKLSKAGFKKIVFQTTKKGVIRVVVSQVPSEKLNATQSKLRAAGYRDFIVRERK